MGILYYRVFGPSQPGQVASMLHIATAHLNMTTQCNARFASLSSPSNSSRKSQEAERKTLHCHQPSRVWLGPELCAAVCSRKGGVECPYFLCWYLSLVFPVVFLPSCHVFFLSAFRFCRLVFFFSSVRFCLGFMAPGPGIGLPVQPLSCLQLLFSTSSS